MPISLAESMTIPHTQFHREKIAFYQQGDSQRASSWKVGKSWHGVQSVLKKSEETGQVVELSIAGEKHLKVVSLRGNKVKQRHDKGWRRTAM